MRTLIWSSLLLSGCGILPGLGDDPCSGGSYECPEAQPVPEGVFDIEDEEGMVDAVADVTDDRVVIEYADDDGHVWRVVYTVVEVSP